MNRFFRKILGFIVYKPAQDISLPPVIDYSVNYNADGVLTDDFYLNLSKTIVWTESIIENITDTSAINYSTVLRTTNPLYEGKPFYRFHDGIYNYAATPSILFDYNIVLKETLSVRNNTILPDKRITAMGRILKFEIDITTHDGAPCSEGGFVDESDIPPIDTWFYITKTYLYCWIPQLFVDKMNDIIAVEMLGSYTWLDESDPYLNDRIIKRLQGQH